TARRKLGRARAGPARPALAPAAPPAAPGPLRPRGDPIGGVAGAGALHHAGSARAVRGPGRPLDPAPGAPVYRLVRPGAGRDRARAGLAGGARRLAADP